MQDEALQLLLIEGGVDRSGKKTGPGPGVSRALMRRGNTIAFHQRAQEGGGKGIAGSRGVYDFLQFYGIHSARSVFGIADRTLRAVGHTDDRGAFLQQMLRRWSSVTLGQPLIGLGIDK